MPEMAVATGAVKASGPRAPSVPPPRNRLASDSIVAEATPSEFLARSRAGDAPPIGLPMSSTFPAAEPVSVTPYEP